MMLSRIKIFLSLLTLITTLGSDLFAQDYGLTGRGRRYLDTVNRLISRDLYFTSVPILKTYLASVRNVSDRKIDNLIDRVITEVGIKQFESLSADILEKSSAPTIKYILAKKFFRMGKYRNALAQLRWIGEGHPVYPFAMMLKGSINALIKKYSSAVNAFQECISVSKSAISDEENPNKVRQLAINRDTCIVGIPRAKFAAGNYKQANLDYLDLSKKSYVWPEILFEEAWNSFYLRDYNRTLGKLVTYNVPIFSHIFNPEVEVLKALAYFELCLWRDAMRTVDEFYRKYQRGSRDLKTLLKNNGRDYGYFFQMAKAKKNGEIIGKGKLVNRLMESIIRDPTFIELYESFLKGGSEFKKIGRMSRRTRSSLSGHLKEALFFQRDLIGVYVRKTLHLHKDQLEEAFKGMSNIKLEVLARKKERLFAPKDSRARERGDVKYVKRNDKQYFWTFNGEFWADELGDYVFALRSECRK